MADKPAKSGVQRDKMTVATDAAGALEPASSDGDVAAFLDAVNALQPVARSGEENGRLIFAMDATMSRQPTWDMAQSIQAEMFEAVKRVGGLDVQLIYFRGFGECRSSKWVRDPVALANLMTSVSCRAGHTQIGKVLLHARRETEAERVHAVVYVGDAMEEQVDDLGQRAGELGLLGLPVFVFQEGRNRKTETAFREIARLSGGAYSRFDSGSAAQLKALLSAVAVYASGGRSALEKIGDGRNTAVRGLLEQLR
ncbi:MAG: VWA domain-containing protein [Hyphomicrobiaceae bacterium]